MIARGALTRTGAWRHCPEHVLTLTPGEQASAERILPLLRETPLDPPWVRDFAKRLDLAEADVRLLLRKMGGQGLLFQVVRDRFFVPEALERLAAMVRALDAETGEIRAADFRDRTGLGRKRGIQILEYFDQIGPTRRVRDTHRLHADSLLAHPGEPIE